MSKTASPTDVEMRGWNGVAVHYRLSEPLAGHEFVIVSAANVPYSGPETYIFGATADGDVENWAELPGSYRGGLSHTDALALAGYEVAQ